MENRLINYLDGLWAITDIVSRTNHKPTVRRLVVPGHERDEARRRRKHHEMKQLQTMMMNMPLPSHRSMLMNPKVLPRARGSVGNFW